MQALIRRSVTVRGTSLGPPISVNIELGAATFELRFDRHRLEKHGEIFVQTSVDVPPDVQGTLLNTDGYRLKAGDPSPDWRLGDEPASGNEMIPLREFPEPFREWVRTAGQLLTEAAKHAYLVLRWRFAIPGPNNPFSVSFTEWSPDGLDWHTLPTDMGGRMRVIRGAPPLIDHHVNEVARLMRAGFTEPLGHSMLREARNRADDDPRSSIITAVAAAEIGIKQCAVNLEPALEWLMENVPSPPLHKLLSDYLPSLPGCARVDGRRVRAPKKALQDAVELRNQLVHRPVARHASHEETEAILDLVQDTLWLCDVYSGQEWALDYISDDFRRTLKPVD